MHAKASNTRGLTLKPKQSPEIISKQPEDKNKVKSCIIFIKAIEKCKTRQQISVVNARKRAHQVLLLFFIGHNPIPIEASSMEFLIKDFVKS